MTEKIYEAVRRIIASMESTGFQTYADILTHRMTKVAWSSRDELFKELLEVFAKVRMQDELNIQESIMDEIAVVERSIRIQLEKGSA